MALLLYLTGPYKRIEELLPDMPDELEVASITYHTPAKILTNFLKFLKIFETIKHPELQDNKEKNLFSNSKGNKNNALADITVMTNGEEADPFDAATARAKHNIIDTELESINSLLCTPCKCTLCCTGPSKNAKQDFFEIPLSSDEAKLFKLPVHDSDESKKTDAYAENSLKINGKPFYSLPPALYHWKNGWSMILTRESSCPALSSKGACTIYSSRPRVCRKPQVFAAILEHQQADTYTFKNSLVAVWDCPYVRELKQLITDYAAHNETDIIFRENKS